MRVSCVNEEKVGALEISPALNRHDSRNTECLEQGLTDAMVNIMEAELNIQYRIQINEKRRNTMLRRL
jgi:hypothetical protein